MTTGLTDKGISAMRFVTVALLPGQNPVNRSAELKLLYICHCALGVIVLLAPVATAGKMFSDAKLTHQLS